MVFRSKYDVNTHFIVAIIVLVCSPILISPLASMVSNQNFSIGLSIMAFVGAGCVLIPIWIVYSISYQFTSQYLIVKAAFITTKIPYVQIRTVTKAAHMWEGYRISASGDAIHIKYDHGDIKISPTPMKLFLQQLQERCTAVNIDVPAEWQT